MRLWFSHVDALFALRCRVRASNLIFVYCRLEYIKLGSPQDSTWRDFPQALAEMQGVRQYVTLFEAPFVASELEGRESQAIRASSLTAIPPPPPGLQPLPRAPLVDLAGQNLAQWADRVQEVASHMRMPPHVAVECPASDIIEVLNRLEDMTRVRYCRLCFGVGRQCRCLVMPRQASGARRDYVPVVAPCSELRGNGLSHRDHRQHLYSFEGSWNFQYASAGGYGDVASSLYGKLTPDSRSWQRRWGTDPAPGTHRPWPSSVETEGTSPTNAHLRGAGSHSINPL